MKIEVWSDFACPYCYLGEKKLEKAIAEVELKSPVEITFRSFQLNVDAGSYDGQDINTLISKKYGITLDEAKAANDNIVSLAAEVGLNFDFEHLKPGNTALAHEVLKFSNSIGKGNEVAKRIFAAYFEEGIDIGDKNNLLELAEEVDIDKNTLQLDLKLEKYTSEVIKDQNEAIQLGITGVPFFIIDNKYSISGAQSVDYFKKALEKAMED